MTLYFCPGPPSSIPSYLPNFKFSSPISQKTKTVSKTKNTKTKSTQKPWRQASCDKHDVMR